MKAQYKEIEEKMNKTLDALYREFGTIRAGKASPSVLDRVTVDYYGAATPIQQLATISTTDARTLMIQPWDKSTLKLINKAIQASDVGINPTDDGSVIRLVFPAPTEERRKELCKQVSKEGEGAKVSIRNIRRDAVDKFKAQKKANELSEDDLKDAEKDVQELTDKGLVCKRAKGNEYTVSDDRWALEFYNEHKNDDIPTLVHAVMTNEQMWGQDLTKVAGFEEATVKNLTMIREQGALAAYKSCL